ncbi:MAG TPA: ABC transporter permease, partial [Acidobacteriaceae bacterium]|nr:ABC transporter permease [Acidobacteriaceae bacterium]
GVVAATVAESIPMGLIDNGAETVTIEGNTPPPGQVPPVINNNAIGTDYFRTLAIPLVEGRSFTDADNTQGPSVAIVSRAMAEKYWPHQDPLGRHFTMASDPGHPMQVVGVAGDARYGTLNGETQAYFYTPYLQHFSQNTLLALEVRTQGNPGAMAPAIEEAIHGIAAGLPLFEVTTLHQALYSPNGLLLYEVVAALAGVMGTLGLVLAVVGVYGVLSYVVSQKTGEIGVRMALGAERGAVQGMILREAGRLAAVGIVLGLGGAVAAAALMRSLLFGVKAWDVSTLASAAAVLGGFALLASYLPARRASRVNPVDALRAE